MTEQKQIAVCVRYKRDGTHIFLFRKWGKISDEEITEYLKKNESFVPRRDRWEFCGSPHTIELEGE